MPADDGIPERLKEFLRKHVSSVEQLEMLLHLNRVAPTPQTAEQVANALYLSPESAAQRLEKFNDDGLVEKRAVAGSSSGPNAATHPATTASSSSQPHHSPSPQSTSSQSTPAPTKAAYVLAPRNSDDARCITELTQCYRERRVSVINFIFSNPISTIQSFADAFIIGKKNT